MMTLMPIDQNSHPIPTLRLKPGGAHQINIDAVANRNAVPFAEDTSVISFYANVPSYIRFGDETVQATIDDHFFPAGLYYDLSLGDDRTGRYSHISVLQTNDAGQAFISEKF